jgi:hypothetical protein
MPRPRPAAPRTDWKPTGRSVRLYLEPDEHRQLRVLAAAAGVPLSRYTRDLVGEFLRRQAGGA